MASVARVSPSRQPSAAGVSAEPMAVAKGRKVARLGPRQAEACRILAAKDGKAAQPAGRVVGVQMDQRGQRARVGAGQDARQNAGLRHCGDRRGRVARGQQLAHLGADAFARKRL